jgi:hypothetical protein
MGRGSGETEMWSRGVAGPFVRRRPSWTRRYSRRQAIGLLGGSLAGVGLLSLGLAAPAKAANPSWATITGPSGYSIPQLSAVRNGNWFDLTLQWRIVFQASVVNHEFETNWVLYEDDSTSADDLISATVEPHVHSAYSPYKVFIPSQANPSNPREVSFRETIIWHRDDLDTELGGEEIFAYVRVGDNTTNSGLYGIRTTQLDLSP